MDHQTTDVTRLLVELGEGRAAFDDVLPAVHGGLEAVARRQLRRERPGHTLDTGALVNEAYLKLVDAARVSFRDRSHFFAIAARAMRQILVDHARRRQAAKRGGELAHTTLGDQALGMEVRLEEILAVDAALDRLAELDERLTRIVELRFFAGMTEEETADDLGISARTVRREWIKARAWLYKELYPGDYDPPPSSTGPGP